MKKRKIIFLRKENFLFFEIFFLMILFNGFSARAAVDFDDIAIERSNVIQQNRTVKGKVVDEKDNPLPGVTIIVVGSTKGVSTDLDGSYSIDVKSTDKLSFTFIGLESQTIEVGDK